MASPEAERLARAAHGGKSEWVFPTKGDGHIRRFDLDGLPVRSNALRHNFKTIAVTMVPAVEEILTEFLLGHAAKSIPRKYASAVFVTKSRALREAQRQIGARIIDLLGLKDADYV